MRRASRTERGGLALEVALQVLLLLVVFGQLVYLASAYRVRVDLTSDGLYTLTESTTRVLSRLDKRLFIEAFVSPDDELATSLREGRATLRNMLDEYVQRSGERIYVKYVDPQSDSARRERAIRLGIQPQRVQDLEATTVSNKEVWQGLLLRYGSKQKVLPTIGFTNISAQYEAVLTPIIKALTIVEKPTIGVIANPSPAPKSRDPRQRETPQGYGRVLTMEFVTDRYEIEHVDLSKGQLVPDDLETLILIRPMALTDRNKYALDQFLMRGGQLCVFADTDEVSIGQSRMLTTTEVPYDAAKSEHAFREQLASYGARVGERMVLDRFESAREPFVVVGTAMGGIPVRQQLPFYPYWFHPLNVDWADKAELFARVEDGGVDEALARQLESTLQPGVDQDRTKGLVVPGLFWPVSVDLAEGLPAGVEGHVLLRTSPASVEQTPPQDVNPIGSGQNLRAAYEAFANNLYSRFKSEPPQQFGLMVELSGSFRSFFEGKKIPEAFEDEPPKPKEPDPLEGPVDKGDAKDDAGEQGDEIGPPDERAAVESRDSEPAPLLEARDGAKLVVIGDCDFIRDDLVGGNYQNIGGPVSRTGPLFFLNLLDWLAEDEDLFAIRAKTVEDRTLRFDAEDVGGTTPQLIAEAARRKATLLRWLNVCLPPALLSLAGFAVFFSRRARKRTFLSSLET